MSMTTVYKLFNGMSEGSNADRKSVCKAKLFKAHIALNLAGEDLNTLFNMWINGELVLGLVEASRKHEKANAEYVQALADYMNYSEQNHD